MYKDGGSGGDDNNDDQLTDDNDDSLSLLFLNLCHLASILLSSSFLFY
jgi:hypothetical protein